MTFFVVNNVVIISIRQFNYLESLKANSRNRTDVCGFAIRRLNHLGYARVKSFLAGTTGLEPVRIDVKSQLRVPLCIRPHIEKKSEKLMRVTRFELALNDA